MTVTSIHCHNDNTHHFIHPSQWWCPSFHSPIKNSHTQHSDCGPTINMTVTMVGFGDLVCKWVKADVDSSLFVSVTWYYHCPLGYALRQNIVYIKQLQKHPETKVIITSHEQRNISSKHNFFFTQRYWGETKSQTKVLNMPSKRIKKNEDECTRKTH